MHFDGLFRNPFVPAAALTVLATEPLALCRAVCSFQHGHLADLRLPVITPLRDYAALIWQIFPYGLTKLKR